MMSSWILLFSLFTPLLGQIHNAVESEMFSIPISPNLFNWTYQEFDQQYRFQAHLLGKPELPSWLRYIYSGRHHSGFIFGTPPRATKSPLTLEVIGLNRQDYETRRVLLTLNISPKTVLAQHEVELKIDNLNVEDMLDEHRMTRLKDILREKLWPESNEDLYTTFLASAIDLGARLPLKPSDGEGLVVRLGSAAPFSTELKRLREEVRPLARLPSCPREYKRTTVERLFRDQGFTLDWCSFELYNTIYKERTTELVEYLSKVPLSKKSGTSKDEDTHVWSTPVRQARDPPRVLSTGLLAAALALPVLLFISSMTVLTFVMCFNFGSVRDPDSEYFLDNIFHICIEYRRKRSHENPMELYRYGSDNDEQDEVGDNISTKSLGVSPSNSFKRPYSPKSTTNLAANYNRPQPPPYGSNTNSLHHRKSGNVDRNTPSTSVHTPEPVLGPLALEESLKLLNEANISKDEFVVPILKDPITDLMDETDDYVPIDPDVKGNIVIQPGLEDFEVPKLTKYGVSGPGSVI